MSGLTNFNNFMLGLKNNKFNKLDSEGKEVEVSFTLNGPADINENFENRARTWKVAT